MDKSVYVLRNNDYQALQCPFCSNVFVESLWSLLSHLQISHEQEWNSFKPTIENLERLKKVVPRRYVSIIRPAFSDNGQPTDFLLTLLSNSQNSSSTSFMTASKTNSSYSSELCELGYATNGFVNRRKACNTCGEILMESEIPVHNLKHHFFTSNTARKQVPQFSFVSNTQNNGRASADISHESSAPPTVQNFSSDPLRNANEVVSGSAQNTQNVASLIGSSTAAISSTCSSNSAPGESSATIEPHTIFGQYNSAKRPVLLFDPEDLSARLAQNQSTLQASMPNQTQTSQNPLLPQSHAPQNSNRRLSLAKSISLLCTQCGLSFENRCKLTRHLIDHKMAQNPYRCPFPNCLQCYDSRMKFRSHLVRVHKQISDEDISALLDEGDKEVFRLKETENISADGLNGDGDVNEEPNRTLDGSQSFFFKAAILQNASDDGNISNPQKRTDTTVTGRSSELAQLLEEPVEVPSGTNMLFECVSNPLSSSSLPEAEKNGLATKRKLNGSTDEILIIPKAEVLDEPRELSSPMASKRVCME